VNSRNGTLVNLNDEETLCRLDEGQKKRARKGEPNSYEQMIKEAVAHVFPLPKPPRPKPPRKIVSPAVRNEKQRQRGKKRWAGILRQDRQKAMRELAAGYWQRLSDDERRLEIARRRAKWTPRPPKKPKPPKFKKVGKAEHKCVAHLRDYTKGRGLFGKLHGVFEQCEHTRGVNRGHTAELH